MPPTKLVMKNQIWPTGDAIRTELLDDKKAVVAWRESILERGYDRREIGSDPDERCSMM